MTVDVCRTRSREGFGITVGLHGHGLPREDTEFNAYTVYKGESKYRLSALQKTMMGGSYLENQIHYSEYFAAENIDLYFPLFACA